MVLHPCDAACTHAGYIDYQWLSPLLQYVICISQLAVCGMPCWFVVAVVSKL